MRTTVTTLTAILLGMLTLFGVTSSVAAADAEQRVAMAEQVINVDVQQRTTTEAVQPAVINVEVDELVGVAPEAMAERLAVDSIERIGGIGGIFTACAYNSWNNAYACTYRSECVAKQIAAAWAGYWVNCWYKYR